MMIQFIAIRVWLDPINVLAFTCSAARTPQELTVDTTFVEP